VVQRNIEDWAIQQRGLPDDWTHHYLVFSNPGTEQQAIEGGKHEQWLNIVNDPRFILQQIKRSGGAKALEDTAFSAASTPNEGVLGARAPDQGSVFVWGPRPPRKRRIALKKDWAVAIGGVAANGTGTVTTNDASGSAPASTVTVDGQTFTASAPTIASGSGIFTGPPAVGQGVTITYGANVLNLTTNATASSVVGTVSAIPTSAIAPTIGLTNSAGSVPNTLTLTTSGTGATATGTFSGTGSTSGQTITITNGSNALTLTAMNGTYGTGTVNVNNANAAANGDTVTIGPVTYWFEMSQSAYSGEPFNGSQFLCPNTTIPCVWWGTSYANQTQAFYAAITNTPSACPSAGNGLYGTWQSTCYSFITAPNPSVTAAETYTYAPTNTGYVTVTNITGNPIPFTWTSSQTAWLLNPDTSLIPVNTTGTATFSGVEAAGNTIEIGATTYTFQTSSLATVGSVLYGASASDSAGNLRAAINDVAAQCVNPAGGPCFNVSGANVSVSSTVSTNVVTVTNLTSGTVAWSTKSSVITLTPAPSAISAYTSGTDGCTSATAGTFIVSTYPSTSAINLANAINACTAAYPAVGVAASATGNVVTITSTTLGSPVSSLILGGNASNFVWSVVTTGGSGSNGCISSTTGTFISGATPAADASNIAAAINACNSSYPAVGVTASYTSGATFTVSSVAGGPYLAVGASHNTGLFTWGTLTAGSAGSNGCTGSTTGTFATSNNTTTLATNLVTAITACTAAAGITATQTLSTVILAARVAGSTGDCALGSTTSNFTWAGPDMTGGTDGTTSATTFAYWSGNAYVSQAQVAANIAAAINQNTTLQAAAGVSAASNGSIITVTANTPGPAADSYGTTKANFAGFAWGAATLTGGAAGAVVQPNVYPAKYSFSDTTASCSDFVVYPTGTAGATGGASIVAFSNLYSGCSGAVPSDYWAYNTGGMVTTSPVPSLDGTQLAFVQVSGTTASLVLLKWSADSGRPTLPVTPAAATLATYRGCTAPCMVTLAFNANHNDTFSSPFYHYNGDTLWVGDDSGNLHEFTGVFAGTPAEAGSPWPVPLGGSKVSSPVYDNSTGDVVVGDFGGVLYSVTASSGTVNKTSSVGDVIADAPLVDSTTSELYAFVTTSNNATYLNDNVVYQLPTDFTATTTPAIEAVGTGGAGFYLYAGTFDNVYYSSATATGNLYVVGNTGVTTGANLYRIPITNSSMGASAAVVTALSFTGAGATRPWPSPVEEFCNNGLSACTTNGTLTNAGTDYVFFSVNRGTATGCTTTAGHGCVLSYTVSNPASVSLSGTGLNVTTPAGNGCWPTGGIVVDNSVPTGTLAGASQTYFIGLGSNAAGGSPGSTSSNCAASTASTISATQASQSNP
jgi:hypothetical protein